jgi:hypothetical protein
MNDAVKMAKDALRPFAMDIRAEVPGDTMIDTLAWSADQHRAASCALIALAALEQAGEPVAVSDGLTLDEAWQDLVDKDDRTSPEEYPDIALITRGELDEYMRAAVAQYRLSPLPTLQRLGQEFDAGDGLKRGFNDGWLAAHKRLNFGYRAEDIQSDWDAYVYAHPPQSLGQAFDGEGEAIKGKIGDGEFFVDGNKFDLIFRPGGGCYGGGDKIVARMACGETAYWLPSLVARLLNAALSSAKRGEEG